MSLKYTITNLRFSCQIPHRSSWSVELLIISYSWIVSVLLHSILIKVSLLTVISITQKLKKMGNYYRQGEDPVCRQ